jgi:hypothetical protein
MILVIDDKHVFNHRGASVQMAEGPLAEVVPFLAASPSCVPLPMAEVTTTRNLPAAILSVGASVVVKVEAVLTAEAALRLEAEEVDPAVADAAYAESTSLSILPIPLVSPAAGKRPWTLPNPFCRNWSHTRDSTSSASLLESHSDMTRIR